MHEGREGVNLEIKVILNKGLGISPSYCYQRCLLLLHLIWTGTPECGANVRLYYLRFSEGSYYFYSCY